MKHVALLFLALVFTQRSFGQTILDAGFEDQAVASGGFLRPSTGAWTFNNDAGIVRPFSTNSSTGPLNTWSATFAPIEGQQYVSTYAGADFVKQGILFSTPGDYRILCYAAAPDDSVTIPPVGPQTLTSGQFTFTLGNSGIGTVHTIAPGSTWSLYSATFNVPAPGAYDLGIRNTLLASYFINYDAFQIQSVPEPRSTLIFLFGLAAGTALLRFRGAHWR